MKFLTTERSKDFLYEMLEKPKPNLLFIAVGFASGVADQDLSIAERLLTWLAKNSGRRIILLIGIHSRDTRNEYLLAKELEPLQRKFDDDCGSGPISFAAHLARAATVENGLYVAHPSRSVSFLAVPHLHAKVFATYYATNNSDGRADLDTINSDELVLHECLMGSSNLTRQGLIDNIEMNVAISSSDDSCIKAAAERGIQALAKSSEPGSYATIAQATSDSMAHAFDSGMARIGKEIYSNKKEQERADFVRAGTEE